MKAAGKAICVTGGRGALGSRLVRRLSTSRAMRIVSYDLSRIPDEASRNGVVHVQGDILDRALLADVLDGCSTVIHLAGHIDVTGSAARPDLFFDVNVGGTVGVLEACRKAGVRRIVFASTALVYGVPEATSVDESHPVRPMSVYAASKLAAEAAIQGYVAAFGFKAVICRFTNLYGASFRPDTVIGRAITQVANGGPVVLRNLDDSRDFLHVDDAVAALKVFGPGSTGKNLCGVFNVSSGGGVTIRDLAGMLADAAQGLGLGRIPVLEPGVACAETVTKFVMDNRRLSEATGWKPAIAMRQGLKKALDDYLQGCGSGKS